MSDIDFAYAAGCLLGFLLGWGLHAILLQVAYRLGVVVHVGRRPNSIPSQEV